eukprot:568715-Hanusia_phi.AAC.1
MINAGLNEQEAELVGGREEEDKGRLAAHVSLSGPAGFLEDRLPEPKYEERREERREEGGGRK